MSRVRRGRGYMLRGYECAYPGRSLGNVYLPLTLPYPPYTQLSVPPPASRGRVGGLLRLSLAGKSYVHLLPPTTPHPRSLPVATLVLRSPNRAASEELHAVASCALATLGCALSQKRPRLLPGGGAIEVVLASKLREEAERSDGEVGLASLHSMRSA